MAQILKSYLRIILVDYLSILGDLFFTGKHTVVEFNCNVFVFHIEFPKEQFFGSIKLLLEFA
jgi:hypothetical protein